MSINDYFGSWILLSEKLQKEFINAKPYPHVVIDNFFSEKWIKDIIQFFPDIDKTWYCYWNPIEKKYAKDKFEDCPIFKHIFQNVLQSNEFVEIIQRITGIHDLEKDPYLHGAGLHYHPNGGKLDMHLDYSIHPITGKERRINLIVYLNNDWQLSYGGCLELWDASFTSAVKKVEPISNRAIIFQTSDISYHGMPVPIQCPNNIGRKSLAIYYVSPPRQSVILRNKAVFRPLPNIHIPNNLQTLYQIRGERRITAEDLETLNIHNY